MVVAGDRTLFDDWRVRRQRLMDRPDASEQHRQMQLQLLDYLISRYGDSAVAARPARFSAPTDVLWNDRAIVVHHHLRQATASGVKNQLQANRRVGEIVSHLRAVQKDEGDGPPSRSDFGEWVESRHERPEVSPRSLVLLSRAMRYRLGVKYAIAAALRESPYLPRAALDWLCRRLADPHKTDLASAELLACCRGDEAIHYAVRAWRQRTAAGCDDQVTWSLEAYLQAETENPDCIRERLADVSGPVRRKAAWLLGQIGTLDDIALFSDLLALSPAADEDPNERQALLDAMRVLAERN